MPVKTFRPGQSVGLVMFGRVVKGILWILALVAIWVLMDAFVIILGTITCNIQEFLGLPAVGCPEGAPDEFN